MQHSINENKGIKLFLYFILFSSFLFVPLLYTNKLIDPVLNIRFFVLSVITLLSLMFILFLHLNKKITFYSNIINNNILYLFIFYISFSSLSIINAINKPEGLSEIIKITLYFIYFIILLIILSNTSYTHVFTKTIILLSLFILLITCFQLYKIIQKDNFNHQTTYLITAAFTHKNLLSEILIFCLPFAFYGIKAFQKYWRYLSIIISIFILTFVIILLSRTAWLALFTGSLIISTILLLKSRLFISSRNVFRKFIFYSTIILVTSCSSILFYSKLDTLSTFKRQLEGFTNIKYGSSKERIILWKKSITLAEDKYLLGAGIGNWKILMPSTGVENTRSEAGNLIFQRPHNDFVWVFSESGLLSVIPYILIFIFSIFFVIRSIKKTENTKENFFKLMLLFFIINYVIISCFDFPKERIFHSMFLLFILAVIVTKYKEDRNFVFSSKWLTPILLCFMIFNFVITGYTYSRLQSEIHLKKAIKFKTNENFINTIQEVRKINTSYYTLDPTSTPVHWYSGTAFYRLSRFPEAKNEFLKAYTDNPFHLRTLNNLASCYFKINEIDSAEIYYKKCLEISSVFEDALINLSVILFKQDKFEESYSYLSKCKVNFENPKYSLLVKTLLPVIIDELISKTEEEPLKKVLKEIKYSEKWLKDEHLKHINENRKIESQLLLDAIYSLEIIKKEISSETSNKLKKKYQLI